MPRSAAYITVAPALWKAKTWRILAVVLVLFPALAGAAEVITVRTTVDRDEVPVGEPFVLSVEVIGVQHVVPPVLTDLSAFKAEYVGPSTQVSIINGQISANTSYRYRLVGLEPGEFTLGPFAVEYQGRQYQTTPIEVQITGRAQGGGRQPSEQSSGTQLAGSPELRLVVSPAKTHAYVGERLDLTVTLYVGDVRVDDLQYPKISAGEVVVDPLTDPIQRDVIVEGKRYRALRFETMMTMLLPGAAELDASMQMDVVTRRGRRFGARDPFFDRFFGGASVQRREMEIRAEPVQIVVEPLPESGRPLDFSGAVGHFDFALTAKPTDLNAGDPITVQMDVSGKGNLDSVTAPVIPVDERFRAYEPLIVGDEDASDTRVFEQVLIPKQTGTLEVPPVRFSFFDPDAATYRTITRGPISLTVSAGVGGDGPRVVSLDPSARSAVVPRPIGRDIVYIKDAPGQLRPRGTAFHGGVWFAAVQFVPVLGYVGLLLYRRRRERFAADPRRPRFRRAGREVRRALKRLERSSSDHALFYDDLSGVVATYLRAKLYLPAGAVERDGVLARLSIGGCSDELRRHVDSFFELTEERRYAPSASATMERDTVLKLARSIVECMERERRTQNSMRIAGSFALLLPAVSIISSVWIPFVERVRAAPPVVEEGVSDLEPQTAFFQGNAAYAEGRYVDAVRHYELALGKERGSGPLYFNLGNAHFKNGQLGLAIVDYQRAHRLLPRDPDVAANLFYAQELTGTVMEPVPLWQRLAFPIADRATPSELVAAATFLWFGFWAMLATRLVSARARTACNRAAWVIGVVLLVVVSNLTFQLVQSELRQTAVVTVAGETPVRFEPLTNGTAHFPVREGALLDITDERDGWLQVRRQDGRRGWLPRDAVMLVRVDVKS